MAHSDITCISMYCIKKLKKFKNTNTLSIFHKLDISRGKMSSKYNFSAFNPDTVTPYSNFSLGQGYLVSGKCLFTDNVHLHLIPNYLLSNK